MAPMILTSPRASTDFNTFAASAGAPSAEPAPIIVCASSTNRMRFGRSLTSRMTFCMRSSNIPRSMVPATIAFICRLINVTITEPWRHSVWLELEAMREPFDDRGLADARLANEHHGVRPLAMTEDLQDLLNLLVTAMDAGDLVLPGEQIQIRRELLERGGQLEALPQARLAHFVLLNPRRDSRHQHLGLDTMTANEGYRNALALLEDRGKEIGGLDCLTAGATCVYKRQLEHELRFRGDARLTAGQRRQGPQVLLKAVQNLVWVQLEIAHDLRERVPVCLGKRKEDVLVAEQCLLAAAAFLNGSIDDALCRFTNLVLCDVEVHDPPPATRPCFWAIVGVRSGCHNLRSGAFMRSQIVGGDD